MPVSCEPSPWYTEAVMSPVRVIEGAVIVLVD